jgi:hypothetical protein
MTIRRMRIACWIPKATNPHSGYIIRIAFPLQQWLRERAAMLRYTYIACLVILTLMMVYEDRNTYTVFTRVICAPAYFARPNF